MIPLFAVLALAAPPTEVSGVIISQPQVIEEADLTAKPSGRDVASVFPPSLKGQTIAADVTMRCFIDAAGQPKRCDLLAERPYGLGFGNIGVDLMMRQGRFKPRKVNGKPVDGGQVEFTLVMAEMGRQKTLIPYPVWAAAPDLDEMAAAWPADRQGDEAVVVLRCTIRRSGELEQCRAINAADKVMIDAARRLSERFRMHLTPEDAKTATRADVVISLRFLNPASEAARARQVRQPEWTTALDPAAVQAIFPDAAAAGGVDAGRGVADCLVGPDGALTDCRVVSEKPAALGFGDAAVQVAQTMRMNLWSKDGRPTVGARIRLPVEFSLAEGAAK